MRPLKRNGRRDEATAEEPAVGENRVEFYAGSRGGETPRAVIIDNARLEVVEVLLRKRVLDRAGGPVRDVWRCRLGDGREVLIERSGPETWRVSAA